jgi:hypothetical protein
MSTPREPPVKVRRQINVLIVQNNPADSLLTIEAFKALD